MAGRLVERTVLIDDSDIDLFIQRSFLEVYNFSDHLTEYKSAEAAINWLQTLNGHELPPDVIFLDLNMPEVDGFSFLTMFGNLPKNIRDTSKIVVLTSSNSSKDREQAFTFSNVVQFITKPLKQADIDELKILLANYPARS